MMGLAQRVMALENTVTQLMTQISNSASRGTLVESDDAGGAQKQKLMGFYGEELDQVQLWQPFGLSGNCPPGGDVLILSMGGNRDGAQALSAAHPDHRPTGSEIGETTLYDAYGQTVRLTADGITITDKSGNVVEMGSDGITLTAANVEITSGTLTHNGQNIGDTHRHLGVAVGPSTTGVPA